MSRRDSLFAALAVTSLLGACDAIEVRPAPDEPFACTAEAWETARTNPQRFIAHAGGQIDGHTYTNSRQALEAAYRAGIRLFEFDLVNTRDGRLVAAHDWAGWREATGSATDEPAHAEFKSRRLFGKYETLDLDDLERWFEKHPGTFLVTDKVSDFEQLVRGFRHTERLIVEVFGVDEYFDARSSGIRYPMLSLGAALAADGEEAVLSFLATEPVKFAAVSRKDLRRTNGLLSAMRRRNVCVYVFTSSDPDFLEQRFDNVVYGAYTDAWDVNRGTCTGEICETY